MKTIIFLIILTLSNTGGTFNYRYHEVPSLEECYEMIEKANVFIPSGGDAEAVVVMYCSYDMPKMGKLEK